LKRTPGLAQNANAAQRAELEATQGTATRPASAIAALLSMASQLEDSSSDGSVTASDSESSSEESSSDTDCEHDPGWSGEALKTSAKRKRQLVDSPLILESFIRFNIMAWNNGLDSERRTHRSYCIYSLASGIYHH
jgi:hypothetical protein